MATSRGRTIDEKVGDWVVAFKAIAEELTPPALRDQMNAVINAPLPDDVEGATTFIAKTNASMALARLLCANDRAAAMVAALITQTGIKPVALDAGDDT